MSLPKTRSKEAHPLSQETVAVPLQKMNGRLKSDLTDLIAVEEPLEIRLGTPGKGPRGHQSLAITMRTPGHDGELTLGFLFSEGILSSMADVQSLRHCGPQVAAGRSGNVMRIDLKSAVAPDLSRLERNFLTHSSCGVCGKKSIEALRSKFPYSGDQDRSTSQAFSSRIIAQLPQRLRRHQAVFEQTGGLHAAALFTPAGSLALAREDIGRHNAVDKVIGACLQRDLLPLGDSLLLVSGRASFELMQKAAMAGIPVLAAVGAPSSLAVELAREREMTLLGFVREEGFNIYHGGWRIDTDERRP